MLITLRPLTDISSVDLFDGRLETFGVREHVTEATNMQSRMLTDGSEYLEVNVCADGLVGTFTRRGRNAFGKSKILHIIGKVFDVEIASEHEKLAKEKEEIETEDDIGSGSIAPPAQEEAAMTREDRDAFYAQRKDAGQRIDPTTAIVEWCWARVADPYGIEHDLPEEYSCVGREHFACDPNERVWVHFSDLPEATHTALMHKEQPSFTTSGGRVTWNI
jgi:hypothetical protein